MTGIPSDVNVLETLEHEWFARLLKVGGGGLFTFDILIHLDVEMEYIWTQLWTFICAVVDPGKRPTLKLGPLIFDLMYLVQRYMPLIDRVVLDSYFISGAPDPRACSITYTLSGWSSILGIYLSELLLVLRVWAVWKRTSNIGIILVVLSLHRIWGVRGFVCKRDPILTFLEVSFTLVAIPAFQVFRRGGNSHLLKVICRDVVSLINVIVILILPSDFIMLLSPFERILHSILASHAILHIRKIARVRIQAWNSSNITMTTRGIDSTTSEIMFASNVIQSEGEGHERSGSNSGERPFTSG
ncbi:hypothetical protein L218DRAFT_1017507 [Marasmius fiardii PR-910]|nr:hypothetical protein L218DRAFT_1017507 [Marasmius fiardii PR-910]